LPHLRKSQLLPFQFNPQFRNSLLAASYQTGNNLPRFLSYVLPGKQVCSIVPKGFLEFAPSNCDLSWYQDNKDDLLINHVLGKTIPYAQHTVKCPWKNPILVRDTYGSKVFVKWLFKRSEREPKTIRRILIQDSMAEVLVALCLSEDKTIVAPFVNKILMVGEWADRVRRIVTKCPNMVQIAVKYQHAEVHKFNTFVPCTVGLPSPSHKTVKDWVVLLNIGEFNSHFTSSVRYSTSCSSKEKMKAFQRL